MLLLSLLVVPGWLYDFLNKVFEKHIPWLYFTPFSFQQAPSVKMNRKNIQNDCPILVQYEMESWKTKSELVRKNWKKQHTIYLVCCFLPGQFFCWISRDRIFINSEYHLKIKRWQKYRNFDRHCKLPALSLPVIFHKTTDTSFNRLNEITEELQHTIKDTFQSRFLFRIRWCFLFFFFAKLQHKSIYLMVSSDLKTSSFRWICVNIVWWGAGREFDRSHRRVWHNQPLLLVAMTTPKYFLFWFNFCFWFELPVPFCFSSTTQKLTTV